MHENISVSALFGCSGEELKHFYVSELQTAVGTYSGSLLRTSDIICVHFQEHHIPLDDFILKSLSTHDTICLVISENNTE